MSKSKLFSNSAYYMAIGLLPMLISFFTLPVITRYLTTEDYGILSLVRSFISLMAIVGTFQIFSSVTRFYFDYEGEGIKKYFSTLLFAGLSVSLLILIVMNFSGNQIVSLMFGLDDLTYYPMFYYATITVCVNILITLTNAFFKVQEKAKTLLLISSVTAITGAILSVSFVAYFSLGLLGVIQAAMINSIIIFSIHIFIFRKYIIFSFDFELLKKCIKYGVPVIPHALGGYLFMYSDKLVMAQLGIATSLIGLYAIADRLASLFKSVVNSFARSFNPNFIKEAKKSITNVNEFTKETSKLWFVILGVIYFILCNFSEYLIYIMTPIAYHEAYLLVPILGLAYVFRGVYIISINTFYFTKKTKYLPIATVSTGLLNVGLNILFIPYWGVYGAAITTAFCFFLNMLFFEWLSNKKTFSVTYNKASLYFLSIIVIISLLVEYGIRIDNLMYLFMLKFFILIIILLIIYSFNFGGIKKLVNNKLKNV